MPAPLLSKASRSTAPGSEGAGTAADPARDQEDSALRSTGRAGASFTGDLNWSAEALTNVVKNCVEHTPRAEIEIAYTANALYARSPSATTAKASPARIYPTSSTVFIAVRKPARTALASGWRWPSHLYRSGWGYRRPQPARHQDELRDPGFSRGGLGRMNRNTRRGACLVYC